VFLEHRKPYDNSSSACFLLADFTSIWQPMTARNAHTEEIISEWPRIHPEQQVHTRA
jgi:hypothetical protein